MINTEKIVAIEITSKRIRLLVGYTLESKVYILDAIEGKTSGVQDGIIIGSNEVSNTLLELKNKAETTLNFKIDSCSLVIPPLGLCSANNVGRTLTISRNTVEKIDIENALNLAEQVKLSSDYKVIDTIPISFTLDNNEQYAFPPIGKTSSSLAVNAKIYAMSESVLQGFKDVLSKLKIKIDHLIPSPLAASFYIGLSDNNPSHYLLLNIGSEITNLSYIQNRNEIVSVTNYRIGSNTINEAFNTRFNFTDKEAEKYKLVYGLDKNPSFDFRLKNDVTLSLMREEIINVFSSTFSKIQKEVEICSKKENRSLCILLCGGGSKLKGLQDYFESLKIEALIPEIDSLGARDISYLPLLGAISYSSRKGINREKKNDISNSEIGIVRMK